MLFNSYLYIFIFLPFVFFAYRAICGWRYYRLAIAWLSLASLLFYSYWNPSDLPVILLSISVNYIFGAVLQNEKLALKWILATAILFNLILLFHYKYTDFAITNINYLRQEPISLLHLYLPLGISFYTFTQIAYLVDCYKGKVKERSLLNYILFVTFFPHLLAGPIIHHAEMMPQFASIEKKKINWSNLYSGLILFSIGLFKKAVIADYFARNVDVLYLSAAHSLLTFWQAWAVSIGYTIQLYFDFSGYTDMAIGSALLFNIVLPINFNSPYKAVNIQDFWRRWHITLSRFLREYLYIPLGGNRSGEPKTTINIMIVFILGGFWHGAGWGFILWGACHSIAYLVWRAWGTTKVRLPRIASIIIMLFFINVTWVFFRSPSLSIAGHILASMGGLNGLGIFSLTTVLCSLIMLLVVVTFPNSNQITSFLASRGSLVYSFFTAFVLLVGVIAVNVLPNSPFIYFQF